MIVALTREISPAITRCELTHREREPIDLDAARRQHAAYEECLRDAGCRVERLPAGPDMPDSVFIEDTALVVDEAAIVTRPGAPSRRIETAAVAGVLARYRPVHQMASPGTADGGDVLIAGRRVFVGRSTRTNQAGIDEMRDVLGPHGYEVTAVESTCTPTSRARRMRSGWAPGFSARRRFHEHSRDWTAVVCASARSTRASSPRRKAR
jgi:dimethylargininase